MTDAEPTPPGPATGPGYRATVSALALGQILSWAVLFYGFSSYVLPMQHTLGWDKATLMGAYTLGLAVWGVATYAVGSAIDAGHGRAVMAGGNVLAALGCVVWSLVSAPWMLYAAWALLGLAMAMTLYEPAFAVLTKRYPLHYRQGITALTLVGGFASTLSFPLVAALGRAGLDWRTQLQGMAVVLALLAPLHAWALRGPALVAGPAHADAAADHTLAQALRSASFWLLALCFMLYAFGQAAFWAHVMPAFAQKGVGEADALLVLMVIGPAQVAGRLLYAATGSSWPLRRLGAGVLALLPLSLLLFALSARLGVLLLFALLFGIANGLITIVRGALIPLYFGRQHVGRIGGLMAGIGLVSRAAAPLLTAWLLLLVPGYQEVVLLLAALGAAAWVAYWRAGPPAPQAESPVVLPPVR